MNDDLNPQARHMADESMVRNLAEAFPDATVLGVDVIDGSLARAREKAARFGDRVRFENRSIYQLGLSEIAVDYLVVDTLRVPRETFARIWTAWRDGYAETVAQHTGMTPAEVVAHFDDQIETIRDPASYVAWLVPVVSGVVPPSGQPSGPG
jgi:hypothetical protein